MSDSRLLDLLNLCHVPRWAVVPMARPQSVAEHCYRVAAIAYELAKTFDNRLPFTQSVVAYALIHDAPEAETGDIPGHFKRRMGLGLRNDLSYKGKEQCPWMLKEAPVGIVEQVVHVADQVETISWFILYDDSRLGRRREILPGLLRGLDEACLGIQREQPAVEAIRKKAMELVLQITGGDLGEERDDRKAQAVAGERPAGGVGGVQADPERGNRGGA